MGICCHLNRLLVIMELSEVWRIMIQGMEHEGHGISFVLFIIIIFNVIYLSNLEASSQCPFCFWI
jgi:hypothetical protein